MKRYLVFAWIKDCPQGGMNDFKKDFMSMSYARTYIVDNDFDTSDYEVQIYDSMTKELYNKTDKIN